MELVLFYDKNVGVAISVVRQMWIVTTRHGSSKRPSLNI